MDFENKKIEIKGIDRPVHYSRIVASFINELFKNRNKEYYAMFRAWLRSLGLSDEEVQRVFNYATCGKCELEGKSIIFIQHYQNSNED